MAKNKQVQNEEQEQEETKKGKGSNKVIIIILALLVLGAGSFGGVYLFLSNNSSPEEKIIVETKVELLKELTINLDSGGYLKTSLFISFDEENSDLAEEITAKTIEIQDKTIFYLKSKNIEDFKASNEVKLKQDLMAQINTVLTKGELVNIYFPAGLMLQK